MFESVDGILKLLQEQEPVTSTDDYLAGIQHKAELETQLAGVQRELTTSLRSLAYYREHVRERLFSNPESFGKKVTEMLDNIIEALLINEQGALTKAIADLREREQQLINEIDEQ